MMVIDANILIYAHRDDAPQYAKAFAAMKRLAEGDDPWLLTWHAIHEFVAIVTHPKMYHPPTEMAHALEQVDAWMESPNVIVAGEGDGYWDHFKRLALDSGIRGRAIYDVRLAAVGVSHGVFDVLTNDSDFNRIPSIRTRPL